jgi:hypothetical protein
VGLVDAKLGEPGGFIPRVTHFEFRTPGVIHPLIEKWSNERPDSLDDGVEVLGDDRVVRAVQERSDAAAEEVLACPGVQHPFWVGAETELFVGSRNRAQWGGVTA